MIVYRTAAGQWFATQEEARRAAGRHFEKVIHPDDKDGRIAWLNENCPLMTASGHPIEPLAVVVQADAPKPAGAAPAGTITLTDVEEFIQAADHPRLARITENAIYRMRELLGRVPQ